MPLRDVAQMLVATDLDTGRVVEMASRWESDAVLARAVILADDAFSLHDLELVRWARGHTAPARQRRALGVYVDPERDWAAMYARAVPVVPGVGNKLRLLAALAFPRREYFEGRYRGHADRWRRGAAAVVRAVRTSRS